MIFLEGFVKTGALKPLFLKGQVRGTIIFIRPNFEFNEKTNAILTKKGPSNPDARTHVRTRTHTTKLHARPHAPSPMCYGEGGDWNEMRNPLL